MRSDVLLVVVEEGSSKGAWVRVVDDEADMGVSCRVMGFKGEGRWVLVDCSLWVWFCGFWRWLGLALAEADLFSSPKIASL